MFAGQILNFVGNIAVVPVFLSHWSTGIYGEWITLSAVVAYFGVTDFGMSAAAGNVTTAAYARGELVRYRSLQASALVFYFVVAVGGSTLLAIATIFLPIPKWIGIKLTPMPVANAAIWFLGATILWQMPASQLRSTYRTTGDLASTQWLWNLQLIGSLGVTYSVLLLHGGALKLAVWGAFPTIAVTITTWLCLRRSHPELLPNLSEARIEGMRELLNPSLLFGIIMLSLALTIEGPVLLTSRAYGGMAVALLVTTRTLANVIPQAILVLKAALWPELTRLGAVGAEETLQLGHRLFMVMTVTLAVAVAGALWFEGAGIISIWTKNKLVPDVWLLRLLLLALVLQSPWLSSSLFVIANNRHRKLAYSYGVSAVLGLGVTAMLLRHCGLLAVPIGILVGELLACYHFVIKDACANLRENYAAFARRLWMGLIGIALASCGAGYLGHSIAVGPLFFKWVEVGSLTTTASITAAWLLAIPTSDRRCIISWLYAHLDLSQSSVT